LNPEEMIPVHVVAAGNIKIAAAGNCLTNNYDPNLPGRRLHNQLFS